ncbi:MAG: glycosyltransferase family 39 protein [Rhodospirillales bacterium]|nr:glycosyltransferase family 39 protein [Rhodospirillales bacterium]
MRNPSAPARDLAGPALAVAFLAGLSAWRLFVLFDHGPNLAFDEAQYWAWAKDLDFGYYSKPPLVAWVIALTTAACGDGEACVRLSSPFAYFAAALCLYGVGAVLFDRRVGLWSAATFASLPAVSFSAMLISTDPLLLLAWAAALYALVRALRDDRVAWWLLVGACVGVGLLAKYTMVLFLAGLLLYLAWAPERRPWLRSWRPVAVTAVAALFYLPNFLWNAAHGFVSYLHTRDNANLGGPLFRPGELLEFVGSQFAVFGPLLFAALLVVLVRPPVRDDRMRLLLCFALPPLAVITAQSLLSRANANWAAPAYVAATVLVAAWLVQRRREWVLNVSLVLHLATAAALYDYDATLRLLGLDGTARYDIMKRVRGWDEVGRQVSDILARHPGATLMADERKVMANLLYYVRPHPFDAVKWNPDGRIQDHYDLTTDVRTAPGDLVLVTERANADHVAARFERVEPLARIHVPIHPDYARDLRVYRLSGFKGYR